MLLKLIMKKKSVKTKKIVRQTKLMVIMKIIPLRIKMETMKTQKIIWMETKMAISIMKKVQKKKMEKSAKN